MGQCIYNVIEYVNVPKKSYLTDKIFCSIEMPNCDDLGYVSKYDSSIMYFQPKKSWGL